MPFSTLILNRLNLLKNQIYDTKSEGSKNKSTMKSNFTE